MRKVPKLPWPGPFSLHKRNEELAWDIKADDGHSLDFCMDEDDATALCAALNWIHGAAWKAEYPEGII